MERQRKTLSRHLIEHLKGYRDDPVRIEHHRRRAAYYALRFHYSREEVRGPYRWQMIRNAILRFMLKL